MQDEAHLGYCDIYLSYGQSRRITRSERINQYEYDICDYYYLHMIITWLDYKLQLISWKEHKDELHPTAQVSSLLYHEASLGGGVITIFGSNFSAYISAIFDPDIGNRVSSMRIEVAKHP